MFWPFKRKSDPAPLHARIADIDRHLSALDKRLKVLRLTDADVAKLSDFERAKNDTEEAQTLRRERNDLLAERARAQRQLAGPSDNEQRKAKQVEQSNEAFLDKREAETRKLIEEHVEMFRSQGDHHQASLWRAHLVGLRERIARDELGRGR